MHIHPFYELIYIEEGEGTCFTGDYSGAFTKGDMFMWGPDLLHTLKCPDKYYQSDSGFSTTAYVIHFNEECFGKGFFDLPECKEFKTLFDLASFGIKIDHFRSDKLREMMRKMPFEKGISKIMLLMEILKQVIDTTLKTKLSDTSGNSAIQSQHPFKNKMELIHEYIQKNYNSPLEVKQLAEMVHMTVPSFCRKFKSVYLKNFTQLLNEIRIGKAKQLFIEGYHEIASVAFMVGFSSASYFSEQFKSYTHTTPRAFIKAARKQDMS